MSIIKVFPQCIRILQKAIETEISSKQIPNKRQTSYSSNITEVQVLTCDRELKLRFGIHEFRQSEAHTETQLKRQTIHC